MRTVTEAGDLLTGHAFLWTGHLRFSSADLRDFLLAPAISGVLPPGSRFRSLQLPS